MPTQSGNPPQPLPWLGPVGPAAPDHEASAVLPHAALAVTLPHVVTPLEERKKQK